MTTMLVKHPVMNRLMESDRALAIPEAEAKLDYHRQQRNYAGRKKTKQDKKEAELEQREKRLQEQEAEHEEKRRKFAEEVQAKTDEVNRYRDDVVVWCEENYKRQNREQAFGSVQAQRRA